MRHQRRPDDLPAPAALTRPSLGRRRRCAGGFGGIAPAPRTIQWLAALSVANRDHRAVERAAASHGVVRGDQLAPALHGISNWGNTNPMTSPRTGLALLECSIGSI